MTSHLEATYLSDVINEFNLDLVFPRDLCSLIELKVNLYRKVRMHGLDQVNDIYVELPRWLIEKISENEYKHLSSFKLDELRESRDDHENLLYDCEFNELYIAKGTIERIKSRFTKDGRESSAKKVEDYKNVSKILAIAIQILEKDLKDGSNFLNPNTKEIILERLASCIEKEAVDWKGILKNKTGYEINGPVNNLTRPTIKKIISWAKDYSKF